MTLSLLSLFLFSCTQKTPDIKSGEAVITGKFCGSISFNNDKYPVSIKLFVSYPFSIQVQEYDTFINDDGTFSFKVPAACEVLGGLTSSIYKGEIPITPGGTSYIEIFVDENGKKKIQKLETESGLTIKDLENLNNVSMQVFQASQEAAMQASPLQPDMTPDAFSKYKIERMRDDLSIIENSPELSDRIKLLYYNTMTQFYLVASIMDYEGAMYRAYYSLHPEESNSTVNFMPIKPDKSYYSFLKDFNLNDSQFLYANNYAEVLQFILTNKVLNIPPIEDLSVDEWLKNVKNILSDLIGSDKGFFYDMLVANAYCKQFQEDLIVLSDKQKENIRNYFTNKAFADILLNENGKVQTIFEKNRKESFGLKINETPEVEKGKLMETIISKYKGKVVLVDFWATWCGPCLAGMDAMKDIKKELNNDVVFVYITNPSSSRGQWEKKISEIGGEHYYVTSEEYLYLCENLGFNGIPAYYFYDSTGILKNQFVGFPGIEKMQKTINELLY